MLQFLAMKPKYVHTRIKIKLIWCFILKVEWWCTTHYGGSKPEAIEYTRQAGSEPEAIEYTRYAGSEPR